MIKTEIRGAAATANPDVPAKRVELVDAANLAPEPPVKPKLINTPSQGASRPRPPVKNG